SERIRRDEEMRLPYALVESGIIRHCLGYIQMLLPPGDLVERRESVDGPDHRESALGPLTCPGIERSLRLRSARVEGLEVIPALLRQNLLLHERCQLPGGVQILLVARNLVHLGQEPQMNAAFAVESKVCHGLQGRIEPCGKATI